ncbi:hypothetical protein Hanom_Chr04g00280671 [Helianthus anomalus]
MEKQTVWMELEAGSKLTTKSKHQGVKWLFLKVWGKTVRPNHGEQNGSLLLFLIVLFF